MIKWVIAQKENDQEQGLIGVPVSVLEIMKRRGVTEDRVEDFLSPSPKITYDPFLITDLKETAQAVIDAADSGKHICVFGDYDADGITSTALLSTVLKKLTVSTRKP